MNNLEVSWLDDALKYLPMVLKKITVNLVLTLQNTNINILFMYIKTASKDSAVKRVQITVMHEVDSLVANLIRLVIF